MLALALMKACWIVVNQLLIMLCSLPPPNWINASLVKFKLRAVLVMSCNSLDMLKFKTRTEQLTIKCKKICQYDNKKCNVEVSKAM